MLAAEAPSIQGLAQGDAPKDSFVTYYSSLPKRDESTVRFFLKKDTYACYAEDATLIADTFYSSRVVLKPFERLPGSPPWLQLPGRLMLRIVPTLVHERHASVEIHGLSEDHRWRLWRRGSAGNLEELQAYLATPEDAPTVLAIYPPELANGRMGLAFCDPLYRRFYVAEALEASDFATLSSALFQLGAAECVTLARDPRSRESVQMHALLEGHGLMVTTCAKTDFAPTTLDLDLQALLGTTAAVRGPDSSSLAALDDMPSATAALAGLIAKLDLLGREENLGTYRLEVWRPDHHMRMGGSAAEALHVVSKTRGGPGAASPTLYALLNTCKTAMGSRLLLRWLRQPLMDPALIEARLDVVEALVADPTLQQELQKVALRGVPDLDRLVKRLHARKATLQDLYGLCMAATKLSVVADALRGVAVAALVTAIEAAIASLDPFVRLVERLIHVETSPSAGLDLQINPAFHEDLARLAAERRDIKEHMTRHEGVARRRLGIAEPLALEHDRARGWVFRATKKHERRLRAAMTADFVMLPASRGGFRFYDLELRRLSTSLQHVDAIYEANVRGVMERALEVAAGYVPAFEAASSAIAELDAVLALAVAATCSGSAPWTRPAILPMGSGVLHLPQGRHPVLDAQSDVRFVANDVEMRATDRRFLLVTGPNAGGKSTYIRQIGLIVLLAQIGSFVPCAAGAAVSICDAILTRIGSADAMFRGLSSFAAEMTETAQILAQATTNSLVIIDELGRGTSTEDGLGLAWAITEHLLAKVRCFGLFATHFHELTAIGEPGLANLHASGGIQPGHGLVLDYAIAEGASDRSFGVALARLAGIPENIVADAEDILKALEDNGGRCDQALREQVLAKVEAGGLSVPEDLGVVQDAVRAAVDKLRGGGC